LIHTYVTIFIFSRIWGHFGSHIMYSKKKREREKRRTLVYIHILQILRVVRKKIGRYTNILWKKKLSAKNTYISNIKLFIIQSNLRWRNPWFCLYLYSLWLADIQKKERQNRTDVFTKQKGKQKKYTIFLYVFITIKLVNHLT